MLTQVATPDDGPAAVSKPPSDAALPALGTRATQPEVLERLAVASRRGKLAGFEARPPGGGLFAAAAHGHPFDSLLVADHVSGRDGGELTFRLVLLKKMPTIFGVLLALTIWPGVYFMDEVVSQLGLWRADWPWLTYYWYLPLTVIPIPWMWRSMIAKSQRSAREHARETIEGIAREIGGTVR